MKITTKLTIQNEAIFLGCALILALIIASMFKVSYFSLGMGGLVVLSYVFVKIFMKGESMGKGRSSGYNDCDGSSGDSGSCDGE